MAVVLLLMSSATEGQVAPQQEWEVGAKVSVKGVVFRWRLAWWTVVVVVEEAFLRRRELRLQACRHPPS